MSAFHVGTDTIEALVKAGETYTGVFGPLSYYHEGERYELTPATRERSCRILHAENNRSLRARYENANERGITVDLQDYKWSPQTQTLPTPVETLKLCACFDYQACETPDYYESEAAQFIDAIRRTAINSLPGYDEAPWGWDQRKDAA